MNKFFKELLDEGRINPAPLFTYTSSDGAERKAYEFSEKGQGLSAGRFLDLADTMRAFDELKLTEEDFNTFLELTNANEKKILDYRNDPDSILTIVNENMYLRKQLGIRRELADPVEMIHTFMSFIVIEEDENPLLYDKEYNKEKIKRWQRDLEVEKKIPFLGIMSVFSPSTSRCLDKSFLNSIRVANAEEYTNLLIMLRKLSSDGTMKDMQASLESRMETLTSNEKFYRELSIITTNTTQSGINES